jgi:hypothetical protein
MKINFDANYLKEERRRRRKVRGEKEGSVAVSDEEARE